MQNGAVTMENNKVVPQKITDRITTYDPDNSTAGRVLKGTESKNSKEILVSRFIATFVHNNQHVERNSKFS